MIKLTPFRIIWASVAIANLVGFISLPWLYVFAALLIPMTMYISVIILVLLATLLTYLGMVLQSDMTSPTVRNENEQPPNTQD